MIKFAATSDKRLYLLLLDELVPVGLLNIELSADNRAGSAVVTAHDLRRRGYAGAAICLLPHQPALLGTTEFFAGVEDGDDASGAFYQCVGRSGFGRWTPPRG